MNKKKMIVSGHVSNRFRPIFTEGLAVLDKDQTKQNLDDPSAGVVVKNCYGGIYMLSARKKKRNKIFAFASNYSVFCTKRWKFWKPGGDQW